MKLTNVPLSDYQSGKSRKPDFLTIIHRIVCVLSVLITLDSLLMCIFSFMDALDDMRKFGGLGFTYSFGYYLVNNCFPAAVGTFLHVTAEFLLYLILYRRAEKMKRPQGGIWYLSVMLVLHIVIWLHANSLNLPEAFPFTTADEYGLRYRYFANLTILPSIVYLILFILRVRKSKTEHS